jgi:hypothetical protein
MTIKDPVETESHNPILSRQLGSRDSVVGIPTGYGLECVGVSAIGGGRGVKLPLTHK